MNISQLLERKLVMITGKGGTGKTTMSMALGTLAAEQGRRVVLVEVDANRSAFARIHGVNPGFEPTPIVEGVWAVNVRWHDALEEWLTATLKRNRIVKLVLGNRFVQLFLDATPGARELVVLSKVLTLSEEWDLVVVDLPASGHAMSLLRVPEVARSLMSSGPIRQRAEKILAMLRDRDTVLVLVALPEEMVVNETVELWTRIRSEVPEVIAPVVILNRAVIPATSEDEQTLLDRLSATEGLTPESEELLYAGRWENGLESDTSEALGRLEREMDCMVHTVPLLGTMGGREGGPRAVVGQVVSCLRRICMSEGASS